MKNDWSDALFRKLARQIILIESTWTARYKPLITFVDLENNWKFLRMPLVCVGVCQWLNAEHMWAILSILKLLLIQFNELIIYLLYKFFFKYRSCQPAQLNEILEIQICDQNVLRLCKVVLSFLLRSRHMVPMEFGIFEFDAHINQSGSIEFYF